ncbi:MAG: hypothetical protein ACPGJV_11675 [Bacteriovoracaceae bacterium]
MTAKRQVLNSLVGERVSVLCLDREETEIVGELLEIDEYGVTLKYSSHSREFIDWIPVQNLSMLSYKVLDVK